MTDSAVDLRITAASVWLAGGEAVKGRAVVPQIKSHFNISSKAACEAIRRANLIRIRAGSK